MTATKQMNEARKAVKSDLINGRDTSRLHKIAIESLIRNGMKKTIVSEMALAAVLDVTLGN